MLRSEKERETMMEDGMNWGDGFVSDRDKAESRIDKLESRNKELEEENENLRTDQFGLIITEAKHEQFQADEQVRMKLQDELSVLRKRVEETILTNPFIRDHELVQHRNGWDHCAAMVRRAMAVPETDFGENGNEKYPIPGASFDQ